MRVNRKRKKHLPPLLFPEHWLDATVEDAHSVTSTIGGLFEELTANLFGGCRLSCDGSSDICPDVVISPFKQVECKASKRECFVTHSRQYERYAYLKKERFIDTCYALWGYGEGIRPIQGSILHDVLRAATANVRFLILVDLKIIDKLIERCGKKYYIRGRQGGCGNGEYVGYYRIARKQFGPLLEYPLGYLTTLGLQREFFRVRTREVVGEAEIYGKRFQTNEFPVVQVEEVLPF